MLSVKWKLDTGGTMIVEHEEWQRLSEYLKHFGEVNHDFFGGLSKRPVGTLSSNLLQAPLTEAGMRLDAGLDYLKDAVIPQLSGSRGSRYWGFVTGGATPAATLADWLVSSFDQNVAKDGDSIASDVERQAISWLVELFQLPSSFKGVFTTGATAANLVAAIVARQYAGIQQGLDVAKQGVHGLDIEIFSATPHASMVKSLGMAGLGQNNLIQVECLANSEAIDTDDLAQKLRNSNALSKVIIASAGTVTTTSFDDLQIINKLAKEYDAWVHVDAAFGIFERLINSTPLTNGLEQAHSITLDCHKWLNVPYDCGVFLTRYRDIQFASFDVPAPYLVNNHSEPSFMSLGIENSRRFRAFPVWFSLLIYGREGITHWVQNNVRLAKRFAQAIRDSTDYELVYECDLNVVLFRPNAKNLTLRDADLKTQNVLRAINKDGRLFLSPGRWQGTQIIRAAFSNWQTEDEDVSIAVQALTDIAQNTRS